MLTSFCEGKRYCFRVEQFTVIPGKIVDVSIQHGFSNEIKVETLFLLVEKNTEQYLDERVIKAKSKWDVSRIPGERIWQLPSTSYFHLESLAIGTAQRLHKIFDCNSPTCGWTTVEEKNNGQNLNQKSQTP